MNDINETDWKTFRAMAPVLRERYLQRTNQELLAILGNEQQSHTDRFWDVEERSRETAKVLQACLDGHSRSKMPHFMIMMLTHGMLAADDLANFSEALRERMKHYAI